MRLNLFNKVIAVHGLFKMPALTIKERSIYKNILLYLFKGKALDIFEYGSGYSTVYCARFLKQQKIPFELDSVENNKDWYKKVTSLIKEEDLQREVKIHLHEFVPFWQKTGWDWDNHKRKGDFSAKLSEELAYIQQPVVLRKKFDFIVLDGRFRRQCLHHIKQSLKPGGIIFVHDAQKMNYHCGFDLYPSGKLLDSGKFFPFEKTVHQFWVGSHEPLPSWLNELT